MREGPQQPTASFGTRRAWRGCVIQKNLNAKPNSWQACLPVGASTSLIILCG